MTVPSKALFFEILGIPVPQKQTRFLRSTGIAYNPSKKDENRIRSHLRPSAPKEPFSCPIAMAIYFGMPIPKSSSKSLREAMLAGRVCHIKKPDLDNLAYLVTNALKNLVYSDDSQIVFCITEKGYDENPRTIIKITPLTGKINAET